MVNLLSGSLNDSIPIMLGALTGVICSTSGVVNIAIEGQLLLGAFCAAIATSVTGSLWLGLICGALAGSLVGGAARRSSRSPTPSTRSCSASC